jgi:hypothetical protein
VNSSNRSCPQCDSAAVKRIVWTEDAERLASSTAGEIAFLAGPSSWNATAEIDRICTVCGKRFCNDPATQARYDEDSRRQMRRIEAQRRGDYHLFNPRTMSADQIADAVLRSLNLTRDDERSDG